MPLPITGGSNVFFYVGKINTILFTPKNLAQRSAESCPQRKKCVCQEIECEKILNEEVVSENVQNAEKWLKIVVYINRFEITELGQVGFYEIIYFLPKPKNGCFSLMYLHLVGVMKIYNVNQKNFIFTFL